MISVFPPPPLLLFLPLFSGCQDSAAVLRGITYGAPRNVWVGWIGLMCFLLINNGGNRHGDFFLFINRNVMLWIQGGQTCALNKF